MFGMWSPSASPNATLNVESLTHETVPGIQSLFASASTVKCTVAVPVGDGVLPSLADSVSVYAPGARPLGGPPNVGVLPLPLFGPEGPASAHDSDEPVSAPTSASFASPEAGIVWYWSQCDPSVGVLIDATGAVLAAVIATGVGGGTSALEKPFFSENENLPPRQPPGGLVGARKTPDA